MNTRTARKIGNLQAKIAAYSNRMRLDRRLLKRREQEITKLRIENETLKRLSGARLARLFGSAQDDAR